MKYLPVLYLKPHHDFNCKIWAITAGFVAMIFTILSYFQKNKEYDK